MRQTSRPKEHINKRTVTQGKQRQFRKRHEILNELDSTAKLHCNWTSVSCKHKSDRSWANQMIGIGQLSGSSQLSERSGGVSRQSADTLGLRRDFHTVQRLDCVISNAQTRLTHYWQQYRKAFLRFDCLNGMKTRYWQSPIVNQNFCKQPMRIHSSFLINQLFMLTVSSMIVI